MKRKILWLPSVLSLIVGSALMSSARADRTEGKEVGTFVVVASCLLKNDVDSKKNETFDRLGFWNAEEYKNFKRVKIEVSQFWPTGSAPVSFKSKINFIATDEKGDQVAIGQKGNVPAHRVVIHRMGPVLAVHYDPDGGSKDGFLLTMNRNSNDAIYNFTPEISNGDQVAQEPMRARCYFPRQFKTPGTPGTVAFTLTGSNVDKRKSLDSYIDGRAYGNAYSADETFKVTKEEWDAQVAGYGKIISSMNGDKACGKPRVKGLYEANNVEGDTLGYRLDVYCEDILSDPSEKYGSKRGSSFYFDAKLKPIVLTLDEQPSVEYGTDY